MKFYIILICLLLSSCESLKKSIEVEKPINQKDSTISNHFIDTLILDTVPIKSDIILPLEEMPDRNISKPKEQSKSKEEPNLNVINETIKNKKDDIIDKTTLYDNPNFGIVAHSVPKSMQVGKTYTVKLRISKDKNKAQLIDGNGIPISDIKYDSKITIASIRVEPIMSAKLISDSSKMLIQSTSTSIQDIEKEGFTEWEWRLTPIKGGDIFLKIMVSVIVKDSSDNKITKDIPVYNDIVSVKSNISFTIKGFIKEYWQWIMTTIIIPLIVWFYNKKKKKDN